MSVLSRLREWARPDPRDPPRRYPEDEPQQVLENLGSVDEEVTKELLREAEAVFAETDDRVAAVDRRAATLVSGVAIAATVTLTGGGLILDRVKIPDDEWRLAFAVGLASLVVLLFLAGWRAIGASSRIFGFRAPADTTLADRASQDDAVTYRRHRAAYLLWAYGRNSEIAAVKVTYLRKAAFWFRLALIALAIIMGMLVAFVGFYDAPAPTP